MAKSSDIMTSFYDWEGDACRLHEHANGDLTADIYRAGRGTLPISPTDLQFHASEINETRYKELVQEEIALSKHREG
jgi:hypothetical protein